MVRPLPVVRSPLSLREFILSRPADEGGMHLATCVLPTYLVETSDGNVTPLVIITITDFSISLYIQYCDEADPRGHLKDASDITTSVLCADIPCATGTANLDDVIDYLREVVDSMATDEYEVDEILAEVGGYSADARVDVLVDI